MRSRPKVKLLLHPGRIVPGKDLIAEVVLTSRSKTPVDFVKVRMRGLRYSTVPQAPFREEVYLYEWQSKPLMLEKGEERQRVRFPIPPHLPPSYDGGAAKCIYTIAVHVAIPWWPDRRESFLVPVVLPPAPAEAGTPLLLTNGDTPTIELGLDTQTIAAGDALNGSVAIQRINGRTIRGVEVVFVETETLHGTIISRHEARHYRLRVFDGAPGDGQAIPFRVRVPAECTPSFLAPPLEVRTYLHARALVAWGEDVVLRTRINVLPSSSEPRAPTGFVAPVGNERQLRVWQMVAAKHGFVADADTKRIHARHGGVTMEIKTEYRTSGAAIVAALGWPHLGVDLDIRERTWSDLLAHDRIRSGDSALDDRFLAFAREHAQAKAIVTIPMLQALAPFESVAVDDDGARLISREPSADDIDFFLRWVIAVADVFDAAQRNVPPPALFANDVDAWEAFAARVGGRLERGRMWIKDGHLGPDAVVVGSIWNRSGVLLGTTVEVAIDPPLEAPPTAPEDPANSPAARDTWRELAARVKGLRIDTGAVKLELEGKLDDPQTALPLIELAVSLRRALGGVRAAGPFR